MTRLAAVLGHDRVKALLTGAIAARRLPPSLLLVGPDGVGKRTLALATARALVCESGGGDACEACSGCRRSARGLHPDVVQVAPETRAIKVEQARALVREIQARPFEARARGFVVDEAHSLTEQAQNALLKSLEEPPATSHVMLVTAAPHALLPTIRSRCQVLRLGPLPASRLEEARLRAIHSAGSLGRALAFESEAYRALREGLVELLEAVPSMDPLGRMEAAERLKDQEDLPLCLTTLRSLLRDLVALRLGGRRDRILNADIGEALSRLAAGRLGGQADRLAAAVAQALRALRGNANKLLTMDVLMDELAAPEPLREG
jgi:DNA polymerase-3 subunit delta'